MLDLTQLIPFTLASLVIILSPGADSFVLLRISHSRGVKAGMAALWGINVGNTSQALLMISGVGLLVSKNETAILVLKILGAIYMAYLALQATRAALKPIQNLSTDAPSPETRTKKQGSPFVQGLVSNITNPKPLLFYLAFFPLFIGSASSVPAQLSVLSAIFVGMALIWQTVIVIGAVKISVTMKSAKFNRVMDIVCAIAFLAIAILIVLEI